jgi:DNA-binding NarL/FixJ family response regulator
LLWVSSGLLPFCASFLVIPLKIKTHNPRNGLLLAGGIQEFGLDPLLQKRSKKWVLLVDDEESIRQAVGQFLFDKGYQVTVCPDARSALKTAKTRVVDGYPQHPDLIISDVNMPEMDGIQFLETIRTDERLVSVPVVLLTAKGTTRDRIRGYKAGADAYLPKPFDPEELLSICDNVISRFEVLNGDSIQVDDLQNDLDVIKKLLLEQGGRGVGNGWVEATNVFLAPDERKLLELVSQGLTNTQVGEGLSLSGRRVGELLAAMYKKTGVNNRTELVRWAVSTGNVTL